MSKHVVKGSNSHLCGGGARLGERGVVGLEDQGILWHSLAVQVGHRADDAGPLLDHEHAGRALEQRVPAEATERAG